jgi:ABC-type phosphate transport system permease subunit
MADLALTDTLSLSPSSTRLRRSYRHDNFFHRLTFACALFVFVMFAGIITSLSREHGPHWRLALAS